MESALLLAAGDPSWAVREEAAGGLWRSASPESLRALSELAAAPSWRRRCSC